MSSVPKTKYMGKPFIKKIYETHKKWLGADDKPRKPEKGGDCIRRDLVSEKRGIWSNGDNKPEQNLDVETGNKLKIVISSFDKIIDEYNGVADETAKKIPPEVPPKIKKLSESFRASNLPPTKVNINNSNDIAHKKDSVLNKTSISEVIAPKSMETPLKPNTKIPKLVKAKTCSIIESKCILKKTNSSGNINANSSSPPTKTKSMTNLAFSSPTPKLIPILTDSNDVTKDTPKRKDLVINGPNNTPIKKMFTNTFTSFDSDTTPVKKDVIESPVKVKDLVKRLNSLTEPTPVEPQTPPAPLSKAVSTTNLSLSKKYGSMSKIPVNANLRKSFPSTPCHLDQIDSTGSASEGKIKTKSLNKSRSVQNLAKPKLSLPKPLQTNDKNLGKSVPDLLKSKQSSTNVSKPLAKPKNIKEDIRSTGKAANKTTKPADVKAKVNSGAKPPKPTESTKTVKNNTREKSKSILKNVKPVIDNSNKVKQVQSVDKVDGCIKNLVKKTETFNSKVVENVDPKDAFVAIRGPRDKGVNTVIKKLEGSTDTNVKPTAKVTRNQTFKKTDTGPTFGDKKAQFEPKFMEKTKFSGRTTVRRNASEKIKLDLQNTQEFLSKFESGDQHEYFLDEGGFSNSILKPISTLKSDKHLDYSSDNSDDSGNISNEVDCDETNSTGSSGRSRTSTESLPTVLDGSKRSLSKDIGLDSCEVTIKVESISNEIFFRTGVISQLEAQRDERLAGMVISLQAHCRGYLARRKLQQRKLQDLAVRCLQRNVRKFMLVREWPWWRLLVRVTPLLNVHRTEEELRAKTEELEALKQKLQKLDYERNSLKHDNDKLEAKLSEMTADLAEEHSTSTLAAERLDAETSERLRLEKELTESKQKNKELAQASEKLEMELLYARSDLNGISEEDEDGSEGDGVYKQRYERAIKELEFTKRRLQQQHEDDLEQLVGLKKQLEKKLSDAYEEVEEQRQVVGTWKRKVQKLNGEMNDLKLLLEEQSSRNNLLEKKQRKYDSEASILQDELKKEKQAKDRLCREKEVLMAEKYTLESTMADVRLELDLKEEKLFALQREFDEITCGGKTEEEVTLLRKQKIDCERRLQDQEEELDELAGQVQLLEQGKLRLEMSLESMRKEAKKEAQLREEELEEVRCNTQKKVKALEQQLENEHEERTVLLREKHELERRLQAAADADRQDRAGDEALLQRLKRDLKRTKALLRDTQAQLDRLKAETPGKNMIRQLRNQLEDLECARAIALKTKQSLEQELSETQGLLEEAHKQKGDAEDRANAMLREKSDLQTQLEENEEELAEVLKKYKAAVQQMSVDQIALQEQVSLVSELEVERNHLKEQLMELTSKLESVESMGGASSNLLYKRSELKVKELESKLELEQTTKSRLEVQITRLKETVEKMQTEMSSSRVKEQQAQEQVRKLQRQLREIKEELNTSLAKESEAIIKRKELEKRCEALEAEASTGKADLKLALKRIEDLQSAIQGELEDSISNESDSEEESYGSDESVNTFLNNHKLGSPTKSEKSSISNDVRRLSNTSRSSTSSNLGKDSSYA